MSVQFVFIKDKTILNDSFCKFVVKKKKKKFYVGRKIRLMKVQNTTTVQQRWLLMEKFHNTFGSESNFFRLYQLFINTLYNLSSQELLAAFLKT